MNIGTNPHRLFPLPSVLPALHIGGVTNEQILLMNFAALMVGSTDTETVTSICEDLPESSYLAQACEKLLKGPFGEVDTDCECTAYDGYELALDHLVDALHSKHYKGQCSDPIRAAIINERESTLEIVHQLRIEAFSDSLQSQQ